MSAEITNNIDGVLTITVAGGLTYRELLGLQKMAVEAITQQGKVRFLIDAEKFQGWSQKGDWGDVSFPMEQDAHIEKMAIVGERKWEDLVLVFVAKGLRSFPIEYFAPTDREQARIWLAAD